MNKLPTISNSGWNELIPEQNFFINKTIFGSDALYKMLTDYNINNLLEIGPGNGTHNKIIKENYTKKITTIDIVDDIFIPDIKSDYLLYNFTEKFDSIWCSHVLEHVFNPLDFLKKLYNDLEENGYLFLTVPPLKHDIVVGHFSLWNPGLLIIYLIYAGFDCRNIKLGMYGYNISIIVQKTNIEIDKNNIYYYLPTEIKLTDDKRFDGRITNINWN